MSSKDHSSGEPNRPNQPVYSFKASERLRKALSQRANREQTSMSATIRTSLEEWMDWSEKKRVYRFSVIGPDNVYLLKLERSRLRELSSLNVALSRLHSRMQREVVWDDSFEDSVEELEQLCKKALKVLDFYSTSIVSKIPQVMPHIARLVEGSCEGAGMDPVYDFVSELIRDWDRFCSDGKDRS